MLEFVSFLFAIGVGFGLSFWIFGLPLGIPPTNCAGQCYRHVYSLELQAHPDDGG